MSVRRLPHTLVAMLALAAALAGCGAKKGSEALSGSDNGVYLHIGALKYQVQLSRQLNPGDPEDAAYMTGLAPADRRLAPDQAFFGVWMLVENHSPTGQPPALSYTITDTQGTVYHPIVPDPNNQFAFRTVSIPAHGQLPAPGGPAATGPTQGALLLFKVKISSYDNRPLTLAIDDPVHGQTGTITLDV